MHEGCDLCGGCEARPGRREFLARGAMALAMLAATRLPLLAAEATVRRAAGAPVGEDEVRYDLPAGDGVTIDRGNRLILVRWEGSVYAFGLSCPHQRTVLRWDDDDSRFQCPKHRSRYAPDGQYLEGRATRSMDRYAVRLEADQVVVDTGRLYREDEDPAEWQAAVVSVAEPEGEGGNHGV